MKSPDGRFPSYCKVDSNTVRSPDNIQQDYTCSGCTCEFVIVFAPHRVMLLQCKTPLPL